MTIRKSWMLGAGAAALVAIPAIAMQAGAMPMGKHGMHEMENQPMTRAQCEQMIKDRFAAIDTNKDGYIVQAELDAAHAQRKAAWEAKREDRRNAHFAEMDANKDGSVSKAEFDAAHEKRMAEHDGMKGGDGAGEGREGHDGRGHHGRHFGGMGGMHGMHGMGGMGMMSVASLDTDHDGKISYAEFAAPRLAMFDRADTNHDGTLTPEEHKAAREAMRAAWRAKMTAAMQPAAAPGK